MLAWTSPNCPVLHLGYNGLQVARKQVQGGSSTYVEVWVEVRTVFGSWAGEGMESPEAPILKIILSRPS